VVTSFNTVKKHIRLNEKAAVHGYAAPGDPLMYSEINTP